MENKKEIYYESKYKRSRVLNIVLTSMLIGVLIGGFFTYGLVKSHNNVKKAAQAVELGQLNRGYESPVVEIAENVLPSIVMIKNKVTVNRGFSIGTLQSGTGSGIIYSEDGYIITNQHVIDGANEIQVTLHDGRTFKARVLGQDSKTDLAVLKIDATNLPAATFGDSSKLKVGELAVAIGNPMGERFSGSVTAGIISALDRSISIGENELKLIQTDAAINPGNSGGALVNKSGEVIGINSIKLSAPNVEGMGFAIPIDDALPIIKELIQYGYVKRPWIGIGIRKITDQIAEQYNVPKGIYIAHVYYNSPAAEAGLRVDDIITKVNEKRIFTIEDLSEILEKYNPEDTIKLTIYRNKKYFTLEVKLGIMPPENR